MLILTTRVGESVMIGHQITITVLNDSGGRVQIGVTAPKAIPVDREEIHKRVSGETRPAVRRLTRQR